MRLSISAPSFDPAGKVWVSTTSDSDMRSVGRRVNRAKTLDGGAVFNDAGYVAADRTLVVAFREQEGTYAQVERLLKLYPHLIISTPDGVFAAVPESLRQQRGVNTLRLLVMEELS